MSAPKTAPKTAMVLAAGLGTRMKPLTETQPKPLVTVAGRTLIDRVLDRLTEAGVGTAVVNVHHHADLLERHLKTRTAPKIVISDERAQLLDSGGGVKKALPLLGKNPFFIINADTIWIEGFARISSGWARPSTRRRWTGSCFSPRPRRAAVMTGWAIS